MVSRSLNLPSVVAGAASGLIGSGAGAAGVAAAAGAAGAVEAAAGSLVNCAGIILRDGAEFTIEGFEKTVAVNLGGTPVIIDNQPGAGGAVKEWCINSAAVDPITRSVLANSEDGWLYRWDLAANRISQRIQLTSGIAESYTPTAIGADGTVYAINNAVLFAIAG